MLYNENLPRGRRSSSRWTTHQIGSTTAPEPGAFPESAASLQARERTLLTMRIRLPGKGNPTRVVSKRAKGELS